MAIVTGRNKVEQVYLRAKEAKWVIPCFNSENLTTTEAILSAVHTYGQEIGIADLPICIGITAQYEARPQAALYTHSRRWDIGLRLFLEELKVLAGPDGPYESLQVLIHLDHIIHGLDTELLDWDLSQFSSIMYDASKLPLEENIEATAAFVRDKGHLLLVEGACDEIVDAGGDEASELTSPDKAEQYVRRTGVDFIVANLGTEHRANLSDLQYRGDYARAIKDRVGQKLVLHGGSSVQGDTMASLFADGISKVNVWTLLERESSAELVEHLVMNASRAAGIDAAQRLQASGLLGSRAVGEGASIHYFTTTARQEIVYKNMRNRVMDYLTMWYS
ncbi:class II fructose-bisphosphate aldolase [Paenibacillus sp. GCM10023252]|uniref:class II fructose-bisphosphate aldolase n=1 Tax=Paenibacillus sp. GCM10023252 TaxID=3252649 RepID=UPI003618DF6D